MSDPMVRPDRIGMVTFEVWGDTDLDLQRQARNVINEFAMGQKYRSKIDAVAMQINDGSVVTWRGDVQAWPESA